MFVNWFLSKDHYTYFLITLTSANFKRFGDTV